MNRSVVDQVEADMVLGFFFPGATMVLTGGHERVAAGAAPFPGPDAASVPVPGALA